jgi:hypothetical protein
MKELLQMVSAYRVGDCKRASADNSVRYCTKRCYLDGAYAASALFTVCRFGEDIQLPLAKLPNVTGS